LDQEIIFEANGQAFSAIHFPAFPSRDFYPLKKRRKNALPSSPGLGEKLSEYLAS